MVVSLRGDTIAFLYRLFLPSLKRGLIHQGEVFVAATIRAINADFVWKFAATVVSEGSSLCPGPCSDPQVRSENGVETCHAGSRRSASRPGLARDKGRDPPLQV